MLKSFGNWNGVHWRLFEENFGSWRRIKWVMFKNVFSESKVFRSVMSSTQNGSVNFVSDWWFPYDQDRIRILQRCLQGRKCQGKMFEIFIFCPKIQLWFPEKIVDFFWVKNSWNVVVWDFLAVDNFDFTRKIVKKNLAKSSWKCSGFVKIEFLEKNWFLEWCESHIRIVKKIIHKYLIPIFQPTKKIENRFARFFLRFSNIWIFA